MTTPIAHSVGFRGVIGELIGRTAWSAQQLAEHQRERLAALLRRAVTASPYYRRVLGPDGVDAPLGQLPTLSKATLMEQFDDIVTDPRLRRSGVDAHLTGPHAAQPLAGCLVLAVHLG